jgi:hypothetical protein
LKQLNDDQLTFIHSLLDPAIPVLVPDYDFTRVLPRFLCIKIFSMLDPRTLCRSAQVGDPKPSCSPVITCREVSSLFEFSKLSIWSAPGREEGEE